MNKVRSYELFLEQKKVGEIIQWIDYSVNESTDTTSFWSKVLDKIKGLSREAKRKIIKHALVTLLVFNTVSNVWNIIKSSSADEETKQIATEIIKQDSSEVQWKMGYEFTPSQKLWSHIKSEEGDPRNPGEPVLKAYKLGDGRITIGWGHAEKIRTSKYTPGQKITRAEADDLLKADLLDASNGVKRMFKEWEDKGMQIKITQDMFDALVSVVFNAGIGSLRKSEIVQDIKRGKLEEAGEKIKTFKTSKKFPGLQDRREKESEMFLASL